MQFEVDVGKAGPNQRGCRSVAIGQFKRVDAHSNTRFNLFDHFGGKFSRAKCLIVTCIYQRRKFKIRPTLGATDLQPLNWDLVHGVHRLVETKSGKLLQLSVNGEFLASFLSIFDDFLQFLLLEFGDLRLEQSKLLQVVGSVVYLINQLFVQSKNAMLHRLVQLLETVIYLHTICGLRLFYHCYQLVKMGHTAVLF